MEWSWRFGVRKIIECSLLIASTIVITKSFFALIAVASFALAAIVEAATAALRPVFGEITISASVWTAIYE